eukprot:7731298-Pyramimonas_sp.AAC.1
MAESASADGVAHEQNVLPSVEEPVDEIDLLGQALSPLDDVHFVEAMRAQGLPVQGDVWRGPASVEPWSGEYVDGRLGHPLSNQERQGPLAHQFGAANREYRHHEANPHVRAGLQH